MNGCNNCPGADQCETSLHGDAINFIKIKFWKEIKKLCLAARAELNGDLKTTKYLRAFKKILIFVKKEKDKNPNFTHNEEKYLSSTLFMMSLAAARKITKILDSPGFNLEGQFEKKY